MTQRKQHNEALANWDNEGGATRSQGELREKKGSNVGDGTSAVGRRDKRTQQSELPMNYVPVFIPVLLMLGLTVVTLYRPPPAADGALVPRSSVACEALPCR